MFPLKPNGGFSLVPYVVGDRAVILSPVSLSLSPLSPFGPPRHLAGRSQAGD